MRTPTPSLQPPNQGSGGMTSSGVSLRDRIALDVLCAEIAARRSINAPPNDAARAAYRLADAMLRERQS